MSKRFLKRSFEKTVYRFQDKPELLAVAEPKEELLTVAELEAELAPTGSDGSFGIYVQVPFCQSLCNFCPFYKEIYNFSQCNKYVDAVISEIEKTLTVENISDSQNVTPPGKAEWLYFGGGTPNILTVHQLVRMKDAILSKVHVENVGIELLPDILNAEYIKELRIAKFTKVSLGVESLQPEVLRSTGRSVPGEEAIAELVRQVKYRGLWLNLDFIIGLPGQDRESFLGDVKTAAGMEPDQMTIYPFMRFGNVDVEASMPDREQYNIIEEAGQILKKEGYRRIGIWTFARGGDVYDLSRDELAQDYLGFGPGASSIYGQWKVVNPEVKVYMDDWKAGKSRGFVAHNTRESNEWRKFARKLYDMDLSDAGEFVKEQRKVVNSLKKSGFIAKDGQLTENGLIYAHDITRMMVENVPYPFQNPNMIENYDEYLAAKGGSGIGGLE